MSLLRAPGPERRYSKDDLPPRDSLFVGVAPAPALSTPQAMRHGAVFASINFLADLISTMPIDSYYRDPRDPKGIAEPIADPAVIAEPAPDIDRINWLRQLLVSWFAQGNLFGLPVAYDDRMRPRLVQSISPEDITALRPNGRYGAITWKVLGKPMPNMLHRPAYTLPGEQIGLSPLGLAAATVGLGISAAEFGRRWFIDGAHPSSAFTSDQVLDPKVARQIKKRIMATLRGNREPLVLGAGLKYQAISIPANESQFLETIGANLGDVARFFGLKATDIGGKSEDSMTYANVEQRGLDRLVYPVNTWVVRLESFLNSLLMPGQFVKLNVDATVRVDLRTRTDVHVKSIQGGIANVDERRELENKPPLPDGKGQRFLWPPMSTTADPGDPSPADIAALIQKLYLGVDVVITVDEARRIIEAAGADLDELSDQELLALGGK